MCPLGVCWTITSPAFLHFSWVYETALLRQATLWLVWIACLSSCCRRMQSVARFFLATERWGKRQKVGERSCSPWNKSGSLNHSYTFDLFPCWFWILQFSNQARHMINIQYLSEVGVIRICFLLVSFVLHTSTFNFIYFWWNFSAWILILSFNWVSVTVQWISFHWVQ